MAFALILGILLVPGIQAASAQPVTVAKVPFSFIAQGKVLPAGEYLISMRQNDPTTMRIVSADGKAGTYLSVLVVSHEKACCEATLVFKRVGAGYFLSAVNIPGESARELVVPRGAAAAALAMLAAAQPANQG